VIRAQLNPYIGSTRIILVGKNRWASFPAWRQRTWREKVEDQSEELKKQGKPLKERPARVSNASIRSEMEVFRAIMERLPGGICAHWKAPPAGIDLPAVEATLIEHKRECGSTAMKRTIVFGLTYTLYHRA
jgi:hypothetical protein